MPTRTRVNMRRRVNQHTPAAYAAAADQHEEIDAPGDAAVADYLRRKGALLARLVGAIRAAAELPGRRSIGHSLLDAGPGARFAVHVAPKRVDVIIWAPRADGRPPMRGMLSYCVRSLIVDVASGYLERKVLRDFIPELLRWRY